MKLPAIKKIVNRLCYDSQKATVLASDCFWDGHNWERNCRNRWLMKSEGGRYFIVTATMWQGEGDHIEPIEEEQVAISIYEDLPEHEVEFEQAFPGVRLEDA